METATTGNNPLANRDYTMIIDRSGSMTTKDVKGKSRWDAARESTEAFSRAIEELDPDGIRVVTFAGDFKTYENTKSDKVAEIWKEKQPMGGTVLAPVLQAQFNDYLARKKAGSLKENGEMLIVVTDGQPEDEEQVAKCIIDFTKKLENGDGEYGIQFLQIGSDDGAAKFLKRLDDDLEKKGAKFDIVDTKTFAEIENMSITEVLTAALND